MKETRRDFDFGKLDENRFLDLVSSLVYPLASWQELKRFPARPGLVAQLAGTEILDRSAYREWWIRLLGADGWQAEFRQLVFDLAEQESKPDVLLLIIPRDLAQREIERLTLACSEAGIRQCRIWGRSTLVRLLEHERPDLGFAFFGIDSARRVRIKARALRRRVSIKKQLHQSLLLPTDKRPVKTVQPYEKMSVPKVLIRSIDDDTYPLRTHSLGVAAGWTELGTYDFYHNGLEVVVGVVDVIVDKIGNWRPVAALERFDATRFRRVRAFEVGRIPYDNIVVCDPLGDEYFRQPHLFCSYACAGQPFEDFRYYSATDPFSIPLEPDRMLAKSADTTESIARLREDGRRA